MVWQKAREIGALPTRLVHAGEIFEWTVLEPWADKVSVREAEAEIDQALVKAQAEADKPAAAPSGGRVHPGVSHEVDPRSDTETRRRRSSQRQAETP